MTGINILLACLGGVITISVVVGMVFLTPGGTEPHPQTPLEQPHHDPAMNSRPAVSAERARTPEAK